jgi:hypothetical protein
MRGTTINLLPVDDVWSTYSVIETGVDMVQFFG